MAELRRLEYFVLRYMADVATDEFVNIGLVVVEPRTGEEGFSEARFRNWRHVEQLDADIDIEMLEALRVEIDEQLKSLQGQAALVRLLETSYSGVIQLSEARGCLTTNPAKEIETLASIYFREVHKNVNKDASTGRLLIRGRKMIREEMNEAFERTGVAKLLMRDVAVDSYTKQGDPFKFDFGYRVNDEIKLFQAVTLDRSVDAGLMLAARYPKIATGMRRVAEVQSVLTAVVDEGLDYKRADVQFALSLMEEERIKVAAITNMAEIAETARIELKA